MKRDILPTAKTINRFNQWKKDTADLDCYRPYITVRQVNKVGRRHWLFCKRQRREVHLLSDGEMRMYTKLLWKPGTIRVMEQFALDLDDTLEIAVAGNLIHPRNWETSEAYVMTTDFLVQSYDIKNPSRIITTAYSFKYFSQIYKLESKDEKITSWHNGEELKGIIKRKNQRTWQKFAIEAAYWHRRGVKYIIVTEKDATKEEFWNIRYCESESRLSVSEEQLNKFLDSFIAIYRANFNKSLSYLIVMVSQLLDETEDYVERLFKYTVLNQRLPLKHTSCLQPNRPVEL